MQTNKLTSPLLILIWLFSSPAKGVETKIDISELAAFSDQCISCATKIQAQNSCVRVINRNGTEQGRKASSDSQSSQFMQAALHAEFTSLAVEASNEDFHELEKNAAEEVFSKYRKEIAEGFSDLEDCVNGHLEIIIPELCANLAQDPISQGRTLAESLGIDEVIIP